MSVTIPATGSGSATPVVATESLDNSVTSATSDNIQQMSLVNVLGWMRWVFNSLAQSLSLASDPGTGRLRVSLQDINLSSQGQTTSLNVTINASSSGITVQNISATAGGGNKPDTMIFDAMQNAWANSVLPCLARS